MDNSISSRLGGKNINLIDEKGNNIAVAQEQHSQELNAQLKDTLDEEISETLVH
jgi:hypothetical protein